MYYMYVITAGVKFYMYNITGIYICYNVKEKIRFLSRAKVEFNYGNYNRGNDACSEME